MLESLVRRLSATRFGPNKDQAIAGSVGAVIGVTGESGYETLFKKADKALYHVKRNGKNGFAVYAPEMDDELGTD